MPEEAIETQEIQEKLEEAQEHAEHAKHGEGHKGPSWILSLSLSTALIAVFAAIASLLSGSYANEAIVRKDEAILGQSKVDDAWAFYQARGIKSVMFATQADVAEASNAPLAAKLRAEAEHEKHEQAELQRTAKELEDKVAEADRESEHNLHVHHLFAQSVTIFQVAIALSAIAALTRKRPMWWVSLATGAGGFVFFVNGLLKMGMG